LTEVHYGVSITGLGTSPDWIRTSRAIRNHPVVHLCGFQPDDADVERMFRKGLSFAGLPVTPPKA